MNKDKNILNSEEKTIKELAEDLTKKGKSSSHSDDKKSTEEKEKLREIVLDAIKHEDLIKKEETAAQSADSHIFDKKNPLKNLKDELNEKLEHFYRSIFTYTKNLNKKSKESKKENNKLISKDLKQGSEKKSAQDKNEKDKNNIKKEKQIGQGFLIFLLNLLITLLLLSGLVITLVGVAIYQNSFFSNTTQSQIVNLIPYPAGIVNNHFLSIAEFRGDVAALNRFYAVQKEAGILGDIPQSTSIQDIVWERYIQNSLIQDIADKYNIHLSEKEVQEEMDKIIKEAGGKENLDKQVAFLYGWTVDKFAEKIVKPYLLREKIAAAVFKDKKLREEKKQEAQEILQKVRLNPDNFPEYAKEYSQDESSKNVGGDLGYFVEGAIVPKIENVLKKMKVGEVSDLIETNEGYEIFKLEDKISGKDGRLRLRARRILIRYPTFEELLSKERRRAKIYRFIY